jgi:DNA-binding SARP family transcriptional activator
MFSLKLLGGAELCGVDGLIAGRVAYRRRLALLAVLAAAGRAVGREYLIGLFWPRQSTADARHNLREHLSVIRRELGVDPFITAGDTLALDPNVICSDVESFDRAVQAGELDRAADLYAGPFLQGFTVTRVPQFQRWAESERERRERIYADVLSKLAAATENRGEFTAAAEWWKKLRATDPASGRIVTHLLRVLERSGDTSVARREAADYLRRVRREKLRPAPEVLSFVERLRAETSAPVDDALRTLRSNAAGTAALGGEVLEPHGDESRTTAEVSASGSVGTQIASEAQSARTARSRRKHGIGIAAATLLLLAGAVASQMFRARPIEASAYVVLPFTHREGSIPTGPTPEECELLLYDALSRWTDVQVVDGQRTRDVISRRGRPQNLPEAMRIARELGAGKLIWGEVVGFRDSVYVRASVYDARKGDHAEAERTVRLSRDLRDLGPRFAELAVRLLVPEGSHPVGADGLGTRSIAALRAYQTAQSAMSRWDLDSAAFHLERAVELDPSYASAWFWLAQVGSWAGKSVDKWAENAARAAGDAERLPRTERGLSTALLALSEGRFEDACGAYESLVGRDSLNFAAWYGIGECHRRDPAVVEDPRSPSGFRFRGSYHRAITAYGRALRSIPSSHLAFRGSGFHRLSSLFFTEPKRLRFGAPVANLDSTAYAAYPGLLGDTLAMIPYPLGYFTELRPEVVPQTIAQAVARNREQLRSIARTWVEAYPRSADAREVYAFALEQLGILTGVRPGRQSALGELRIARSLAREHDHRLRLAISQVRVYLKAEDFRSARLLADSLLGRRDAPTPHDAQRLASLAVLTGRRRQAIDLLRVSAPEYVAYTPTGEHVNVPPPVAEMALEVLGYHAFGPSREGLHAERRLEEGIRTWIEPGRRERARSAVLNLPRRLSFTGGPSTNARPPLSAADYVVMMQQDFASGATGGIRERFLVLQRARAMSRPGDIDIDFVLPEAELLLALGDTSRAVRELDASLSALPTLSTSLLDLLPQTAALVRTMLLRAEVAELRNERAVAARWRNAVTVLWSGGDPEVRLILRHW